MRCRNIERLAGGRKLFLKAETFQTTGSFKVRGALNAVLALPAVEADAGVVTHSSGNHGAALAKADWDRQWQQLEELAALAGRPAAPQLEAKPSPAQRAAQGQQAPRPAFHTPNTLPHPPLLPWQSGVAERFV